MSRRSESALQPRSSGAPEVLPTSRTLFVLVLRVRAAITLLAAVASTQVHAADLPSPGEGHRATAMEIAQLPQFCWAQYTEHRGPEYSIPAVCGPAMNHYCFGLVEELRANRSFGNTKQRMAYLRAAKSQTTYTINGMKNHPGCPIRPHVEQTYQRIDARIRAAGGPLTGSPPR